MSRYLFVGDPHAEPHDLPDARALADFIWRCAKRTGATVLIAGDLYHTHAIIHAEVQYFWWGFLEELRHDKIKSVLIKGNHDAPGTHGSLATPLLTHYDQAVVVSPGPLVQDNILFCPYTDGKTLVLWSEKFPECGTLVCHQTFDGSRYENGFFAGDGVDPNLIKQKRIISGHIHTPQEFGKVWYPGAPRWRTLSDANIDRAIWLLEFDDNGHLVKRTPFDTGDDCRRIHHFVDTPATPVVVTPNPKDEYRVDLHGPQAWIDERLPYYQGWAKVRATRTDGRTEVVVKESEGVGVALEKYVDAYQPRYGTAKETLTAMVKDRVRL